MARTLILAVVFILLINNSFLSFLVSVVRRARCDSFVFPLQPAARWPKPTEAHYDLVPVFSRLLRPEKSSYCRLRHQDRAHKQRLCQTPVRDPVTQADELWAIIVGNSIVWWTTRASNWTKLRPDNDGLKGSISSASAKSRKLSRLSSEFFRSRRLSLRMLNMHRYREPVSASTSEPVFR